MWNVGFNKDGRHRTNRFARGTIRANHGIYVHLFGRRTALDAINRANVNAIKLLRTDARFTNYKCQLPNSLRPRLTDNDRR